MNNRNGGVLGQKYGNLIYFVSEGGRNILHIDPLGFYEKRVLGIIDITCSFLLYKFIPNALLLNLIETNNYVGLNEDWCQSLVPIPKE